MKRFTITLVPLLIATVALMVVFGLAAELQQVKAQIEDVTNYNGVHLSQSSFGTATPQLLIQNSGSANSLEIRDGSATPIVSIDAAGNSTFAGTVDLSGATVSGVSTSTLSTLTVTGAATFGEDGTAGDVKFYSDTAGDFMTWDQSAEALVITGTNAQDALDVNDGNVDIEDDIDVNGTTNLDDVDIDLSASLNIDGHLLDVGSGTYTVADGDNDVGVDGDLEVNGAVVFGADSLYPLGYATASKQIVCGTTTFTETSSVPATGLTAIDYVVATQITTPASTGAFLTVSDPTTTTFILSSWEGDYTAGTTAVAAHWCAVGTQ